jgi:hypothetical protein
VTLRVALLATAALAAVATAPGASSRGRPVVSLSASPARLILASGEPRKIRLTNFGTSRLTVDSSLSGVAVDVRGRPRLASRPTAGRNAAAWLQVRPQRLTIRSRGSAVITVGVRVPRRAQPGDHHAAVVLATRPLDRGRVSVRMRLAVRVSVRAPGRVRRRLEIRGLTVRRVGRARLLELRLANRGNVTEKLAGRVTIAVGGRKAVRVGAARRELLPGRLGVLATVYRGAARGLVRVRIGVRGAGSRTFRIRL